MFRLLLCYFLLIFACMTKTYAFDGEKSGNSPSVAATLMQQYDFNRDGQITEKEFIVGDGDSAYRAHLSNVYQCPKTAKNADINEQTYWFIEMINPAQYQQDLKDYFAYLDADGDEYISAAEYVKTFAGKFPPDAGEKYLQIIDVNQDGRISRNEYVNFDFTSLPMGSHEVFHNLDANNDSFITVDELESAFTLRR